MNKKGVVIPAAIAMVLAVGLGIISLVFLLGGGISTTWRISQLINSIINTLSSIPNIVWVILGIIILFKLIGRKRR